MNILLINPPNCGKSIPEERFGIETIKMLFRGEPLALETIAGNLPGHEVAIIDLKADPNGLTEDRITVSPDLIGITGVTCEANTMLAIARKMKDRYGAPVVVGGHHASNDPAFFKQPSVDYIVVGLGKMSFRQLVEALQAGTPPDIPGIVCKGPDMHWRFTPRSYGAQDLVDACPPRYDLVSRHRAHYVMSGLGGRTGFVATAFGCTHNCAFCSIPNLTGNQYLRHSIDAVVRDIQCLEDIPVIRLVDANTFGAPDGAMELARRIRDAGITKRFVADVRADTVVRHPELFALWREAGLTAAVIGFEEINDARLKAYNKKSAHGLHLRAIDILKKLDIRIVGDFIIAPDYGEEDFTALDRFVATSGIDLPIPAILTPLPGTPLYRQLEDRITNQNLDYYTFTNAVMPTRMAEKNFYSTYADMLKRFLAYVHAT